MKVEPRLDMDMKFKIMSKRKARISCNHSAGAREEETEERQAVEVKSSGFHLCFSFSLSFLMEATCAMNYFDDKT